MAETVIIHFTNEDPVIAEMEEIPNPSDGFIQVTNPRRRDGKALYYLTEGSIAYIFPMHRISFIEIMAPQAEHTDVVEFFRS